MCFNQGGGQTIDCCTVPGHFNLSGQRNVLARKECHPIEVPKVCRIHAKIIKINGHKFELSAGRPRSRHQRSALHELCAHGDWAQDRLQAGAGGTSMDKKAHHYLGICALFNFFIQVNQITSWIDSSPTYGSSNRKAFEMRSFERQASHFRAQCTL